MLRRIVPCLLTLILLGCAGAAPLPERAQQLNRLGVEALERGDLETADARLSVALEYHPRFVEALTNLGLVELLRGNFSQAERLLRRAVRYNPDIAQPHHGLGVLAEKRGRPDDAAEYYRAALEVDPGFGPARANLARLLFDAGQLEAALIQFRRLIQVNPELVEGYAGLTECLLARARSSEARAVLDSALDDFPNDGSLLILHARMLLAAQRAQQAKQALLAVARRRDDVGVAALGWIAAAELALGNPEKAIGAAERALTLSDKADVALYVMALALSRIGDPSAGEWVNAAEKRLGVGAELRRALEALGASAPSTGPE